MKVRKKIVHLLRTSNCKSNIFYIALNGKPIIIYHYRLVQQEITALSHMAEHLNTSMNKAVVRPNASEPLSPEDKNAQNLDSVDLDNLFAFLTDGANTTHNALFDDINDKMRDLVLDIDNEVRFRIYLRNFVNFIGIFFFLDRDLFAKRT